MIYTPDPFNPYAPYDNQIPTELLKANDNFKILGVIVDYFREHGFGNDIVINPYITTPTAIPYTEMFIQTFEPSNENNHDYTHNIPNVYTSWYNPADNSLKYYNGSYWVDVNWKDWIFKDPWYKAGRLRINDNDGSLELLGYSGWFKIFPSLGKVVEVYANDYDPNEDYKIIYLMPGQTFLMRNKSVVRVAIIPESYWRGYITYGKEDWLMFKPSNQTCLATGDCLKFDFYSAHLNNDVLKGFSFKRVSSDYTNATVPFTYGGAGEFSLYAYNGGVAINTYTSNTAFETIYTSRVNLSPNVGYFLGTFYDGGNRYNIPYLAITRQA
jgi:hypothetical protein